ncbi:hypothetical protein [Candidatus Darwinibacter acetoxidans]
MGEFYRVEAILVQSGLRIDTEQGISDEGDPWFAFCRADEGDVIVHIARIRGIYVLAGPWYNKAASGSDISSLVRDLVAHHPLITTAKGTRLRGSNIYLHPAALLVAIVATAFFKSAEARALTDNQKLCDTRGGSTAIRPEAVTEGHSKTIVLDAAQSAIILSAVALAIHHDKLTTAENLLSDSDHLDFLAKTSEALETNSVSTGPNVELPINPEFWKSGLEVSSALKDVAYIPEDAAYNPAVQKALPLIAILTDCSVSLNTRAHTGSDDPVGTSNISPMLIITFGAPGVENSLLPDVQVAKIGYSDASGGIETHAFSGLSQLSATLIGAVQGSLPDDVPKVLAGVLHDAVHRAVDVRPPENMLFDLLMGHQLEAPPVVLADAVLSRQTLDTSSLHSLSSEISSPLPPASEATANETTHTTVDVINALRYFLDNTSHWLVTNTDQGIIVYDADAMNCSSDELTSVTFDFADGSTLSLVGLPAALHDPQHVA